MAEFAPIISPEEQIPDLQLQSVVAEEVGKMSVLEALAEEAPENLTPSMTWQSAWTGKEDR